ncbi:MAG: hypothetical protein ACFE0J_22285 [Elainellaceae cyanobacterium]
MTRLAQPQTDTGHSIIFWHEEPGITVIYDNSSLERSEFERFLQIGFFYTPVSVLQACDHCGESWQWAIASDDNSLDIVWLVEALSRFEDGWEVTPDNWVISKPDSKIELVQMTSIVSEAKRPPKQLEPVTRQTMTIPLIATAVLSFALGLLTSIVL